jgi:hypothetical protein
LAGGSRIFVELSPKACGDMLETSVFRGDNPLSFGAVGNLWGE